MIEGIKPHPNSHELFRLGNLLQIDVFAKKKGLSPEEVRETIEFIGERSAEELVDGPFHPKTLLNPKHIFGEPTRFSDGSWPVFYSALDKTTAQKEVKHHYAKSAAGRSASRRPVYYLQFRCDFSGRTIDLCPKLSEWPNLVSENLDFCQTIGGKASKAALEAFTAPSARNSGGTTVPVFQRHALSDPQILATVRYTFNVTMMEAKIEIFDH